MFGYELNLCAMNSFNKNFGVINQTARIRELANLFIEKELRKLNIDGVLPAHGSIFVFLFNQNQAVPMKDIVGKVGRVKSTVTGMINTLEQHGYLTKYPSAEDGRVILVELTEKGRQMKPIFESISKDLIGKAYGEMAEADRDFLIDKLIQIRTNLEQ